MADYIVLTYQEVSNVGNLSKKSFKDLMKEIPDDLYDDACIFSPNTKLAPQINETNKRNLGLKKVKQNKCTHFLSLDCDEFYDHEEFLLAKQKIVNNNYDATACKLTNYFHTSSNQMQEVTQYVPFIYKISWFRKHVYKCRFPVVVDPTRAMLAKKFYLFSSEELVMHHMSYVRKDFDSIKWKLLNSPNKHLYLDFLDDYLEYFNAWNEKEPAMNPHQFIRRGTEIYNKVRVVDNPIKLSFRYRKLGVQ